MLNLKNLAKTVTSGGDSGYTKIDDLYIKFPTGVTVNGITLKTGKGEDDLTAFTFAEIEGGWFYAESGDLRKIVDAWTSNDTIALADIDAALKENPVKMIVQKVTTKSGRNYVRATIVDE